MSLPREAEEPPPPAAWLPSHVQVWVLQARGLRAKGGPGDAAFVALQLGRQKHRTAVAAQKGGCPRWAEQCALELPPPPPPAPRPAPPPEPEPQLLQLVVWQRALVGPDRFLGRAALPLAALLQDGRSHPDRWYKLHSKPGKKEKERGEIQLSLQFTRHSLTASMFDLSVKEKPRSPFRRLRDKMKGKHSYDLDSSSAIVPSTSGALDDDFRPGAPKDKARGSFFFKGQLRRSSLTHSSTSLGSTSTLSSASSLGALGSTEGGAPSPSRHSSLSTDPAGRDFLPSPQLTHKRAFSDEVSQINLLPEAMQGLKTPKDPSSSGSSLCINGSHIYCQEPTPKPTSLSLAPFPPAQREPGKQDGGSGAGLPVAQPDLPPWPASGFQKGPPKDPPRFIPSPPILAAQEEDKLSVKTIALNKQRVRARREEGLQAESKPVPMAAPLALPSEVRRVRPQDERDHRGSLRGHGQSPEPRLEAPLGEKEEPASGNSRISLRDSREPARKPSSQPGLPATPELAKDPWVVSEDQGLPPSIQAGEAQPSPLAPPASHLQPPPPAAAAATAAPVRPPVEGDDGFAAFAASRLPPASPGPEPPPATELPGGAAGPLPQQEEAPPSPERASQDGPDWLSLAFGERGRAWSGSGGALLARGPFGEEANSTPREEQGPPGEAAFAQNVAQLGSSVPLAPDVPEEAPSWTPESCPRNQTFPSLADPSLEQLDWGREQQMWPQSQPAPQAESSEPYWLPWDPQREEEVGVEEAAPTSRGPAQEAQREPAEAEGPRGAGTPPPKPSRRVPPLHLTEEASGAGWGTPESSWPRGADPELPPPLPPVGPAGSPPAAAVSLVPAVIIGAGPPEGPPLALLDGQPEGQEESLGATILAAEEGPSAGALAFSTCPSQLSLGGLGLSGVPESPRQDGETGFAPWGLEGAWPTGLPGSASLWSSERFPRPPEASQGLPEPRGEPSPSLLFWSALEEPQRLPGGGDHLESPCSLGQSTGTAPSHSGPGPEPPSGGPKVQAMDFRKASFWQQGSGQPESKQEDPPLTPGNPFAPWAAPSPQKNPFVERPPAAQVPWAQAAILPVSPTGDAHSLGEFPAATDPPRQPRSHSFSVELPVGGARPAPPRPLAFSTPSFQPLPSPTGCPLPSPLGPLSAGDAAEGQTGASPSPLLSAPSTDTSPPSVLPMEMLPAQDAPRQQAPSPHPVKPMRSTPAPGSPCTETARQASSPSPGQITGQDQFTPISATSGSFAASVVQLEKTEPRQSPPTKYHHLTREELLQLLLRREAELGKKEEQVRELEGYIDRLLVRIMEQSPTLLQIPLEERRAKATQ